MRARSLSELTGLWHGELTQRPWDHGVWRKADTKSDFRDRSAREKRERAHIRRRRCRERHISRPSGGRKRGPETRCVTSPHHGGVNPGRVFVTSEKDATTRDVLGFFLTRTLSRDVPGALPAHFRGHSRPTPRTVPPLHAPRPSRARPHPAGVVAETAVVPNPGAGFRRPGPVPRAPASPPPSRPAIGKTSHPIAFPTLSLDFMLRCRPSIG